jgi:RNA polymerase sigma factor (sigma-70 family)
MAGRKRDRDRGKAPAKKVFERAAEKVRRGRPPNRAPRAPAANARARTPEPAWTEAELTEIRDAMRSVIRRSVDAADVEDLVSEAFLALLRCQQRGRKIESLIAYARGVAALSAKHWLFARARRARPRALCESDECLIDAREPGDRQSEERATMRAHLLARARELPERCRRVLCAVFDGHQSIHELAAAVRMERSEVNRHWRRIVSRFCATGGVGETHPSSSKRRRPGKRERERATQTTARARRRDRSAPGEPLLTRRGRRA